MSQKQKGRGDAARPPHVNLNQQTLARGEIRAKTLARVPFNKGDTLPPLSENIIIDDGVRSDIEYLFKIQLTNQHSVLVLEKIGEGAMGLVFRAVDELEGEYGKKKLGGEVAVKLIHIDPAALGSDPERKRSDLYEKFADEVLVVRKLNNNKIIRIDAYGKTESPIDGNLVPFYTMEFLKGKDLEVIVQEEKTLSWERLRPLMLQVCSALSAAHEYEENGHHRPIIHRDIKPSNVFITTDRKGIEQVKLLDFGIAMIAAPQNKKKRQDVGIWGTLEYMSPEQVLEKETDHRADIYSVGSMMYHLLSGRTTFLQSGTIEERLSRILKEAPAPFIESGIFVSPEVERIIFKCLEKAPNKGFQSAEELTDAIEKCDGNTEEIDMAVLHGGIELDTTNRNPYRESPNGPIAADKTAIVNIDDLAAQPDRTRRRIIFGLAGATGLAAISSAVVLLTRRKPEIHKPSIKRSDPDSSTELSSLNKPPLTQPVLDSSVIPDKEPESKEFKIVLKTNVRGVEVLLEDQQLCKPSDNKTCTFNLSEGIYPVEVTFRKKGYLDQVVNILPDMNKEVYVRMQKARRRRKSKSKKKSRYLLDSE
jgi:serine/threonine-protein kinase